MSPGAPTQTPPHRSKDTGIARNEVLCIVPCPRHHVHCGTARIVAKSRGNRPKSGESPWEQSSAGLSPCRRRTSPCIDLETLQIWCLGVAALACWRELEIAQERLRVGGPGL